MVVTLPFGVGQSPVAHGLKTIYVCVFFLLHSPTWAVQADEKNSTQQRTRTTQKRETTVKRGQMFRSVTTLRVSTVSLARPLRAVSSGLGLRFQSTIKNSSQDEDTESWLNAVKELKARYQSEGVPDFESPHMQQLVQEKFEPNSEQLAKFESLQGKPIPQKIDSVVQHCTNMIMKDGKKAKAERIMARALYIVRLQLREDPVEVLKKTLDQLGPLMELKTYKTRVAKNLTVPVPLNERQRNRRAFLWIIEGSEKRRSKDFAVRLGEEIISAYEGKSSGYDKRLQMHKAAMLHRAYIKLR